MRKVIKVFICLFISFSCLNFCQFSSAKYVLEDFIKVASLNIDRSKPKIEFFDFSTQLVSESENSKLYSITGYFKIIEKNLIEKDLLPNNLKFYTNNNIIVNPNFKNFYIVSKNNYEITYEFSFLITIKNEPVIIEIPKGLIIDKSGLTNDKTTYSIAI